MTARFRLELLQWTGLFAAAGIWIVQMILGFGFTQAKCNVGGARWGISNDTWQLTLLGIAVAVILAAEAAAVAVFVRTRGVEFQGQAPRGRMHFFAAAAIVANVLFLMIVLLDGIASVVDPACVQS